ncbi:MAG: L,D-transpeptidase [Opitutales bacterium]|nr:L,D-transpeptidase [Opitutales bacterium]
MDSFIEKILEACAQNNVKATKHCIFVKIAKQKLYLFKEKALAFECAVSTSRNKPSCKSGSNGTPLGLHKIDGKIGDGLPLDTVFRGRKPDGILKDQPEEEKKKNLILGRIMRLRGLEEGVNSGGDVDTYARYIYIHGTNQEGKIGSPNSHGCVLLASENLKKIFDETEDGSIVYIEK